MSRVKYPPEFLKSSDKFVQTLFFHEICSYESIYRKGGKKRGERRAPLFMFCICVFLLNKILYISFILLQYMPYIML